MKKLLAVFLFVSTFVVVTFLLFADFEAYIETNLDAEKTRWAFAGFSFTFLLSDILFPIPSSLIMILNGKVLGFALGGLLSSVAGICSSLIGFALGRKSEKYLNKWFSEKEVKKANVFFEKYGKLSVALSRAIPILSETIAVLSGTTRMKFKDFFIYSTIGHIVVSLVYAWVGAFTNNLNGNIITVIVVGLTLLLSWGLQRFVQSR